MFIEVVKSKIHRVTVTEANLNYIGSITIDEDLMDAANLIDGIQQTFAGYLKDNQMVAGDVPLLGSSVAAAVFKDPDTGKRVHEEGVLLICLASRLIEAQIGVGTAARHNPEPRQASLSAGCS